MLHLERVEYMGGTSVKFPSLCHVPKVFIPLAPLAGHYPSLWRMVVYRYVLINNNYVSPAPLESACVLAPLDCSLDGSNPTP